MYTQVYPPVLLTLQYMLSSASEVDISALMHYDQEPQTFLLVLMACIMYVS